LRSSAGSGRGSGCIEREKERKGTEEENDLPEPGQHQNLILQVHIIIHVKVYIKYKNFSCKKIYKNLEKDKRYLERKHVKERIIKYNIK